MMQVWPDWAIFESYWWQIFSHNLPKQVIVDFLDDFEKHLFEV